MIDKESAKMVQMVAAWEEVLSVVPTVYLEQCYLMAIRSHDSSFPLGVGEVFSVWEKNKIIWIEEAKQKESAEPKYCERCSGTGFEIVMDAQGRSKGSRPCPDCNMDRLAKWVA